MKIIKKGLSIVLSLTLVVFSISFINAEEEFIHQDQICSKISGLLLNHIRDLEKTDTVSVYLWYPDINQNEIDKEAEVLSKVDPKEIEKVNSEFNTLKEKFYNENFYNEKDLINQYIAITQNQRKVKAEQVEKFLSQRNKLCLKEYDEKSKKIQDYIGLNEESVIYCSRLAPMIIASLSVEKIYQLENSPYLECIDYYEQEQFVEESHETAAAELRADTITLDTDLNLSGLNVKIGLVDNHRPLFSTENPEGIVLDTNEPEYTTVNNTLLTNYGNLVVVGSTTPSSDTSKLGHPDKMAKDILYLAPDVILYTSSNSHSKIETMIMDGVHLFSMSLGSSVGETSNDYAYTSTEKWLDHLAAYHRVTFLKSAGNNGQNSNPRVTSPGMAYNIITVGYYHQDGNDRLSANSSYKNCTEQVFGCEKPDIVSPSDMFSSGSSNACAFFAGVMTLMFELEPALLASPQEAKAIVLASCHKKALQTESMGGQEDFDTGIVGRQESGSQSGITERQGAGCPDVWIMASIICQGTYGSDVLINNYSYLNIHQPPYGAENMNVSLAFLKENLPLSESCSNSSNIIEGITNNLDLTVYNNDLEIKKSALFYSSTEMCRFQLSDSDFKYRFKIERADSSTTPVRYAYAWSTDNPRCTLPQSSSNLVKEGVYHVKNRYTEKYLECNFNSQTENYSVELNVQSNDSQSYFSNDSLNWIVDHGTNGVKVKTGIGFDANYLGTVNYIYNNPNNTLIQSTPENLLIEKTGFGYYCIFNADKTYLLSINNGVPYWKPYITNQTIQTCDTWCFERNNFLKGDVDCDGALTLDDATEIQHYLGWWIDLNNIQRFLADITRDGIVNVKDVTQCQRIVSFGNYYLI